MHLQWCLSISSFVHLRFFYRLQCINTLAWENPNILDWYSGRGHFCLFSYRVLEIVTVCFLGSQDKKHIILRLSLSRSVTHYKSFNLTKDAELISETLLWTHQQYMGADKSLALPGRKQATATDEWVSYNLFIIIIWGILILFMYITRLASNEIFSP